MKHPDKPFVVVAWDDAYGNSDEVAEHEIEHRPLRAQSYGWLLRSDPAGVTLASEWNPKDGRYRDSTFIPRPVVVEEVVMTLAKRRKRKSEAIEAKWTSTPSVSPSS